LTFLASCLTIGLIAGKKTEGFANFCLFKRVTQKKRIDWNGFVCFIEKTFQHFLVLHLRYRFWFIQFTGYYCKHYLLERQFACIGKSYVKKLKKAHLGAKLGFEFKRASRKKTDKYY
jgi:hypothetical protein